MKNSLAWYDVAIHSTMKSCMLPFKNNGRADFAYSWLYPFVVLRILRDFNNLSVISQLGSRIYRMSEIEVARPEHESWIPQSSSKYRKQLTTALTISLNVTQSRYNIFVSAIIILIKNTNVITFNKDRWDPRHGITMIYDCWNHSQAPPKKPPYLSYTHYNKAGHGFFYIVPKKRSIQDKTQ